MLLSDSCVTSGYHAPAHALVLVPHSLPQVFPHLLPPLSPLFLFDFPHFPLSTLARNSLCLDVQRHWGTTLAVTFVLTYLPKSCPLLPSRLLLYPMPPRLISDIPDTVPPVHLWYFLFSASFFLLFLSLFWHKIKQLWVAYCHYPSAW